jgi:tRNA pseudouridine32 synthase / 23S rRNA pseudouridine746 synthase
MNALPLPTRNGVGPSCVALPAGPWPTLLDFLVHRFPAVGEAEWQRRIAAREVIDEHGVAVTPGRRHEANLRVYYYRTVTEELPLPFEESVLFQDEWLVAVDKPHFMPVTPGGATLANALLVRLKRRLGIDTLAPVHRLDRETAGVLLFSVKPETRGAYQRVFAEREATKDYQAVLSWHDGAELPAVRRSRLAEDGFLRMREVEGEPNAETRFALKAVVGTQARVDLSPHTGRKHQLRVHCAALGLPIVNDLMYPQLQPAGRDDFARPLQLLAKRLAFRDPLTGEARCFESPRELTLQ